MNLYIFLHTIKKFVKWNNFYLFKNIHKIIIKLLNKDLLFNKSEKDLFID